MKRYYKLNNIDNVDDGYTELSRKQFKVYQKSGKHYFINLGHSLMETSEKDYREFCKTTDREKYLKILAFIYNEISYHALESEDGEIYGEEFIKDHDVNVEETAIESVFTEDMLVRLPKAMSMLRLQDRELIETLFYKNTSPTDLAKELNIPRTTIITRRDKILSELKSFLQKL